MNKIVHTCSRIFEAKEACFHWETNGDYAFRSKRIEDVRLESGCVVFVGYMRRYATAFERVKELIKNLPIKYVALGI